MKFLSIPAQARINYTLTLDVTRKVPNNRAYINEKTREQTRSILLDLNQEQCNEVNFAIQVSCWTLGIL